MGGFCRGGHRYEQPTPYAIAQPGCGGMQGAAYEAWGPSTPVSYDNVTQLGYENLKAGFPYNQNNWSQAVAEATQKGLPIVAVIGSWKDNPGRLTRDILPHVKNSADAVYVYIDKDQATTGEAAGVAAMCNPNRNNVISAVFTPKPGQDGKPVFDAPVYNLLGADQSNIATFSQVVRDGQTYMKRMWPGEKVPPIPPAVDAAPVMPQPKPPGEVIQPPTEPPKKDVPSPVVAPPPTEVDPRKKALELLQQQKDLMGKAMDQQAQQFNQTQTQMRLELDKLKQQLAETQKQLDAAKSTSAGKDGDKKDKDDLWGTFLKITGGAAGGLGLKMLYDWYRGRGTDKPGAPGDVAPKEIADVLREKGTEYRDLKDYKAKEIQHPNGKTTYVVGQANEKGEVAGPTREYSQEEFRSKFSPPDANGKCKNIEPLLAMRMPAPGDTTTPSGDYAVLKDGKLTKGAVQDFQMNNAELFVNANNQKIYRMRKADGTYDYKDAQTDQPVNITDNDFARDYTRAKATPGATADGTATKPATGEATEAMGLKPGDKVTLADGTKHEVFNKSGDTVVLKGDKPATSKPAEPVELVNDAPDPKIWQKLTNNEEGLYLNKKTNQVYDLKPAYKTDSELGIETYAGWDATLQDNYKCVSQTDLKNAKVNAPDVETKPEPPKVETKVEAPKTLEVEPAVGQERTILGQKMLAKQVVDGIPLFHNADGQIVLAPVDPIEKSAVKDPVEFKVDVNGKTETFVASKNGTLVFRQGEDGKLEKILPTSMTTANPGTKRYAGLYPKPAEPGPTGEPKPNDGKQPPPGGEAKPMTEAPKATTSRVNDQVFADLMKAAHNFNLQQDSLYKDFTAKTFETQFAKFFIQSEESLNTDALFNRMKVTAGEQSKLIYRDAESKEFQPLYRDQDPSKKVDDFVLADGRRIPVEKCTVEAQLAAQLFKDVQSADKATRDKALSTLEAEFGSMLMQIDQTSTRKDRVVQVEGGQPASQTELLTKMQAAKTADEKVASNQMAKLATAAQKGGDVVGAKGDPSALVGAASKVAPGAAEKAQLIVMDGQLVFSNPENPETTRSLDEKAGLTEMMNQVFDTRKQKALEALERANAGTDEGEKQRCHDAVAKIDEDRKLYNDPTDAGAEFRRKVHASMQIEGRKRIAELARKAGPVVKGVTLTVSFLLVANWVLDQAELNPTG